MEFSIKVYPKPEQYFRLEKVGRALKRPVDKVLEKIVNEHIDEILDSVKMEAEAGPKPIDWGSWKARG